MRSRNWNHRKAYSFKYLVLGKEDWKTKTASQSTYTWPLHVACLHNSMVASGYMLAQDSKCVSSNEVETMACCLTLSFTDKKTDLGTLSESTSGKETKWCFYIHRWMDKYIK